jgi:ABC-type nitrate/sulfonate/bicarbonate transport system substrate-binding protein
VNVLKAVTRAKFFQSIAPLALFATLIGAKAASGQEKVKFPVGVGTKTLGTAAIFLATKKGFFDDSGLEVQPVLLRGTPITVQALVAESLYVALGSADSTIGAAASGVDLLSVGGVVNGLTKSSSRGSNTKLTTTYAAQP